MSPFPSDCATPAPPRNHGAETMTTSNAPLSPIRLISTFSLAVAVLVGPAGARTAQADGPFLRPTGTYAVEVTLRDCTTGAPAGPAFPSLVTFHGDGSLFETPGGRAFAPGQRADGHGTWRRTGFSTVSQEMIALVVFDTPANLPGTPTFDPSKPITPGFQAGWQTVSHKVTFTDATHATSSGTNAFFTAAGVQYRTGCSTAVLSKVM
jgi:hypothetical protein